MKRDLLRLTRQEYDLVVIGSGIDSISVARNAALRGLNVAMLDQGDFGHATSSNHHKIIHGGLRYLQHCDLKRMRESIRERSIVGLDDRPILLLGILLMVVGFHTTMGLLGEMLVRVYHEGQKKPIYVVREILDPSSHSLPLVETSPRASPPIHSKATPATPERKERGQRFGGSP